MTEKGDKPVLPLRPFLRLISFAGWAEKRSPTEKYIARKKRGCPRLLLLEDEFSRRIGRSGRRSRWKKFKFTLTPIKLTGV
jgi:hypothetical protein